MLLSDVIAQVESGGDDAAVRFESRLYAKWTVVDPTPGTQHARDEITATIEAGHRCTLSTARMIACTSWGRYQLLGMNIYGLCKCVVPVVHFIESAELQRDCLATFLCQRGIDFTLEEIVADPAKREKFISRYNGPDATESYWAAMQRVIARLGG